MYLGESNIMDFEFIRQVIPLYIHAALLTLKIGILGIISAIAIGLLCTLILHKKIPILKQLVSIYIEFSRNTPLLIQLFFIYYGLPKLGIKVDADICGVFGLAFLGGSYMCEAFRSGFNKYTGICSKYNFSFKGNLGILGYKPYGSDVYGKGSDRTVL